MLNFIFGFIVGGIFTLIASFFLTYDPEMFDTDI